MPTPLQNRQHEFYRRYIEQNIAQEINERNQQRFIDFFRRRDETYRQLRAQNLANRRRGMTSQQLLDDIERELRRQRRDHILMAIFFPIIFITLTTLIVLWIV